MTNVRHGCTLLQSSQLAEPLWTDSGLKSGTSVSELISTLKKKKEKKKAQVGNEWSNLLPQILTREEKATTVFTNHITETVSQTSNSEKISASNSPKTFSPGTRKKNSSLYHLP